MPEIVLNNFILGGMADSAYLGQPNSVKTLVGFDLHSEPGILKVHAKLTKDSGSTITEFVRTILADSLTTTYFFSADSGNIWGKDETTGTYSLKATALPAAGAANILDAMEFEGYIYYAMQARLGRCPIAGNWAVDRNDSFATFSVTDANYHPMRIVNDTLYIGDGYRIAQVFAGVFSANALEVSALHGSFRALGKWLTTLVAGTFRFAAARVATLFNWNTFSENFTFEDEVYEQGIRAFLPVDNGLLFYAGTKGGLYSYDGVRGLKLRVIPGLKPIYNTTSGNWEGGMATIHSNASDMFEGVTLFGLSNPSSTETGNGIYAVYDYGSIASNYPAVMSIPFVLSTGNTSLVEIGAVKTRANVFYVSWKSKVGGVTTYGVDMYDNTGLKYAGAYMELRLLASEREVLKQLKMSVGYRTLNFGTITALADCGDGAGYQTMTATTDTQRRLVDFEISPTDCTSIQVKIYATPATNSKRAPELEAITLKY